MSLELNVNGYFDMYIFYLNGQKVSEKEEKELLSKLQSNDYLIDMESRTIIGVNTMKPLYMFEIAPTDSVKYDLTKYKIILGNVK